MAARKIPRDVDKDARDVARAQVGTQEYEAACRRRKKVEMLFAHLKRIFRLSRLRLRGPCGAKDELLLAATAQNLRRLFEAASDEWTDAADRGIGRTRGGHQAARTSGRRRNHREKMIATERTPLTRGLFQRNFEPSIGSRQVRDIDRQGSQAVPPGWAGMQPYCGQSNTGAAFMQPARPAPLGRRVRRASSRIGPWAS